MTERELFRALGVNHTDAEISYRVLERVGSMVGTGAITEDCVRACRDDLKRFDDDCYRESFPKVKL